MADRGCVGCGFGVGGVRGWIGRCERVGLGVWGSRSVRLLIVVLFVVVLLCGCVIVCGCSRASGMTLGYSVGVLSSGTEQNTVHGILNGIVNALKYTLSGTEMDSLSEWRIHCQVFYSTLLYSTLLYSALLYSTLLYSTLLYSILDGIVRHSKDTTVL